MARKGRSHVAAGPQNLSKSSVNLLATIARPALAAADALPADLVQQRSIALGPERAEGLERLSVSPREPHLPELKTKFIC